MKELIKVEENIKDSCKSQVEKVSYFSYFFETVFKSVCFHFLKTFRGFYFIITQFRGFDLFSRKFGFFVNFKK